RWTNLLESGRQPDAFYAEMWQTIRSGLVWHGRRSNRRKDGSLYEEEMRIAPVRTPGGEIVNYVAIKHDVTLQKAQEETQRLLAAIVESSVDAIVTSDREGLIL